MRIGRSSWPSRVPFSYRLSRYCAPRPLSVSGPGCPCSASHTSFLAEHGPLPFRAKPVDTGEQTIPLPCPPDSINKQVVKRAWVSGHDHYKSKATRSERKKIAQSHLDRDSSNDLAREKKSRCPHAPAGAGRLYVDFKRKKKQ